MRAYVALLGVLAGCAGRDRPLTAEQKAEALMRTAAPRTGALELRCRPEDAEVSVDGVPQGTCADFDGAPALLPVGEGMHRVEVKKDGFFPYQTYYQPSGARAVLEVELKPRGNTQGESP